MSTDDQNFRLYIENVFKENGTDFENILRSLGGDKYNLLVNAHFYYYICLPDKNENEVRSELRIVGVVSLIEAMMQEVDYKDFFQYFESQYKGQNFIEDFVKIKKEYLEQYGATKKIREYFRNFVAPEDKKAFCEGIEKYNKNNFLTSEEGKKLYENFDNCVKKGDLYQASEFDKEINSKNDSFAKISTNHLPNLLYQMRSDFVHKAEMRGFCSGSNIALLTPIGKDSYNIEINIDTLLKIFERSFVKFWSQKAEEHSKLL